MSTLDAVAIRQAAIESLAEDTSNSIVAPLWWYALAGLTGAAVYRFVNTADAMWRYRTPIWEWRGKVIAITDDPVNWWPARLTALLLAPRVLATPGGARQARRTARATTSPNAGWPMGALAIALDVRLDKAGVYTLHPGGRPACAADTVRAIGATRRAAAAMVAAAAVTRPT